MSLFVSFFLFCSFLETPGDFPPIFQLHFLCRCFYSKCSYYYQSTSLSIIFFSIITSHCIMSPSERWHFWIYSHGYLYWRKCIWFCNNREKPSWVWFCSFEDHCWKYLISCEFITIVVSVTQNQLTIIDTSNDIANYTIQYHNEIVYDRLNYYSNDNTIIMKDFCHSDFIVTLCSRFIYYDSF